MTYPCPALHRIQRQRFRAPYHGLLALCCALLFATELCLAEAAVKLAIEGAGREQRNNIRAHIGELSEGQLANPLRMTRFIEQKAGAAMQALGYFSATFDVRVDAGAVRLAVNPGTATHVDALTLELTGEGSDSPLLEAPAKALRAFAKQQMLSRDYEQRKAALLGKARRNGFLDAEFVRHEVLVDRRRHTATIALSLNTGRRYHFGAFMASEVPIRQARIDSLSQWQSGQPFATATLNSVQRRLLDAGYFASVVLEQTVDREAGVVDINAVLGMNAPNRFRTGVGFGTDTGPRATISWEKPWLNRSGHSTELELAGSAVKQSFKALYKIPSLARPDTHWQTEFDLVEEDVEDTRSSTQQVGLAYVTPLGGGWRGSFFSKYLREQYTQGSERGRSELFLPGANASLTRSRGGLVPTSGFRLAASVEGAHDGLFSDATLLRLTADSRYITSYKRHRFITGLQLGGLFLPGNSNLDDVPSSLRFFAGGDQSVRGYDYKSLAPRDANNELIGGQYLVVGKTEYNYRFAKSWRAALFVDAGSAFNNSSDRVYLGPGFGLHWLSPIGAMRFDVGFAASEEQQLTLHINIGPEL
ncbi:MAG: autotransporter assembly complex family protein [Pseudomonadales bacterium]